MVRAFVLVSTTAGAAGKLLPMVREADAVLEAFVVSGDHDIVAEVEADTVYETLSLVTRKLRPLDGVQETRTYVVLE